MLATAWTSPGAGRNVENMTATSRASVAAALVLATVGTSQLLPATAWADPEPAPEPTLHNVTYRARVDGVARGATVSYRFDDTQVQTADPTMLPGRVFEATGVVSDPALAGMVVAVEWPYGANLHCEILVNDEIVAQADDFVAPRALPVRDDPFFGSLQCGATLDNGTGNTVNTDPIVVEPSVPAEPPA